MAYLFHTDAISEPLRHRPAESYIAWLATVPREDQFTSTVAIGELFKGAFRSADRDRHLRNVEKEVLPRLSVLPYDTAAAREYGCIRARLEDLGQPLPEADLQIAATAILHGLSLVTGNTKHFERIDGLEIHRTLADAREPHP